MSSETRERGFLGEPSLPPMILPVASSYPGILIHGPFAELGLDSLRIGVNHYD
jgi:hypothetical protein